MEQNLRKEIQEAIDAGERALYSLGEAKGYLRSAGNWGVVDILGGGLITDLIKHSKMDDASRCMEEAKRDLRDFSRELDDIDDYLPNIQVGDFLTFADFFFDGLLTDLYVQSKITDAKEQVDGAISQVNSIICKLQNELKYN